MCAILGQVNRFDRRWVESHIKKSLERGTDLTIEEAANYRLYHTRLPTNPSNDTYPIAIEGRKFAMNGIVAQAHYEHLQEKYKGRTDYTVDSAFLLLEWIDNQNWEQFDNSNYVFSFWLLDGDSLYIGNKDYPLYFESQEGALWFSSFKDDRLAPNGMTVRQFNVKTGLIEQVYTFKDLIYAIN
jgi:hypothetical protein